MLETRDNLDGRPAANRCKCSELPFPFKNAPAGSQTGQHDVSSSSTGCLHSFITQASFYCFTSTSPLPHTHRRLAAALPRPSPAAPFFQQHLLTLHVSHILVICSCNSSDFSIIIPVKVIGDLGCHCCHCFGSHELHPHEMMDVRKKRQVRPDCTTGRSRLCSGLPSPRDTTLLKPGQLVTLQ